MSRNYKFYNPTAVYFVTEPTAWKYSSARNFEDDHTILKIDKVGFMGLDN